ncbi:unconventional myosin-XIX-like [Antedon mediterranea]|uniref:unconventional myosin-XIX-like n=1 Tax=Antedon mediterranea TaxID=105859 RepID=UPI003AF6AD12
MPAGNQGTRLPTKKKDFRAFARSANVIITKSRPRCIPPQVKKKPACRFKKEVVIRGHAGYPVLCTQTDWINTDDLVLINPLSEPAVLNCLRERYLAGRYHTQTGNTLVTLNPFKETGHFDVHMIHRYHSDQKANPPHVFRVAEIALCNLTRRLDKINQSIIVSGESGSGKTWNARCLLKYLTTVAVCNPGGFTPSPADCIEGRILDSNPILEAFGNYYVYLLIKYSKIHMSFSNVKTSMYCYGPKKGR